MLRLMHRNVSNASLGEQYGAFQNRPSDLGPNDLWSHLRDQRKLHKLLGIFEAKWIAKLLDSRYEIENGDLGCHHGHYDVIVMLISTW